MYIATAKDNKQYISVVGVKVMVLGPKSSGKTSMVQTLTDGQSRLTLSDEATAMCDISSTELTYRSEGKVKATVY